MPPCHTSGSQVPAESSGEGSAASAAGRITRSPTLQEAEGGAWRSAGSKANMMDDTIQEEINPEARVPGELWGGSI